MKPEKRPTQFSLINNSRFYVLLSTVCVSVFILAVLRLQIASDQLFFIRLEQVYGLVCVLYWYVALAISPAGYIVGKQRMKHMAFARRAIGVSAAYFAVLHLGFALWGQLGGLGSVMYLPPLFKWSLGLGVVAVVVLLLMAATSFNKVITCMTFKRWKWLHRLGYAGGVLAVVHIWTIGTHVEYPWVRIVALVALGTLAGMEAYRIATLISARNQSFKTKQTFVMLFAGIWMAWLILILLLPLLVTNYHGMGGLGYTLELCKPGSYV